MQLAVSRLFDLLLVEPHRTGHRNSYGSDGIRMTPRILVASFQGQDQTGYAADYQFALGLELSFSLAVCGNDLKPVVRRDKTS